MLKEAIYYERHQSTYRLINAMLAGLSLGYALMTTAMDLLSLNLFHGITLSFRNEAVLRFLMSLKQVIFKKEKAMKNIRTMQNET